MFGSATKRSWLQLVALYRRSWSNIRDGCWVCNLWRWVYIWSRETSVLWACLHAPKTCYKLPTDVHTCMSVRACLIRCAQSYVVPASLAFVLLLAITSEVCSFNWNLLPYIIIYRVMYSIYVMWSFDCLITCMQVLKMKPSPIVFFN